MASEALARWAARTEASLERLLPDPAIEPVGLHAAMRHATLGGGKRMRPLLVYAAGAATGADEARLDAPAAAVELLKVLLKLIAETIAAAIVRYS